MTSITNTTNNVDEAGIPTMFASAYKTKKKPAEFIQEKVQVFQKEAIAEKWIPNKPTMELHGDKKEKKEERGVVPAVVKQAPPTRKVSIQQKPEVVTDTDVQDKDKDNMQKYNQWVERMATKEEEQVVLTEAFKQERAAKRAERRVSLEEKLAKREERKKKLEEKLAANKAVAIGQDLFKSNNMFTPEYRERQAQIKAREEEQRKAIEEQKKRLEEKLGPIREKIDFHNAMTEETAKEYAEREAAWKAQKEAEKAAKIAKKLEDERKKEEYEKRRDARRNSPPRK